MLWFVGGDDLTGTFARLIAPVVTVRSQSDTGLPRLSWKMAVKRVLCRAWWLKQWTHLGSLCMILPVVEVCINLPARIAPVLQKSHEAYAPDSSRPRTESTLC